MAERNLNFDEIINRKNTDCLKYDFAKEEACLKMYFRYGLRIWILKLHLMWKMRLLKGKTRYFRL